MTDGQWRFGLVAVLAGMVLGSVIVAMAYGLGKLAGAEEARPAFTYTDGRRFSTRIQAAQFGNADTLVLGDSLVELTDFTGACGRTFAAGLGGARTEDAQVALPLLIESLQPEIIVIAIGTNHFTADDEYELMQKTYPALVNEAGKSGRVVLVGINNSERGDALIRQTAEETNAVFLDPPEGPMLEDGLHYNEDGATAFRDAVANICKDIRSN